MYLTFSYWFTAFSPAITAAAVTRWWVFSIACILGGIALGIFARRRPGPKFLHRPWLQVATLLDVTGAILLVLLFLRYEGVPLFSARCWILFLAVGDLVWIIAIIRRALRIPQQRAAWEADQAKRRFTK